MKQVGKWKKTVLPREVRQPLKSVWSGHKYPCPRLETIRKGSK